MDFSTTDILHLAASEFQIQSQPTVFERQSLSLGLTDFGGGKNDEDAGSFIKSLRVDDRVGRCALDPAGRPEGRCRGRRIRPLDVPHSPRSCGGDLTQAPKRKSV